MQQRRRNPWKSLGLAIAIVIPTLLVVGAIVGMLEDDRRVEELARVVIADSAPPVSVVEECNRYAEQADRGEEAEAKRDVAPAGASADVAAGAPGNAGKNASRRSTGTLVGMSEQNSRSAATRAAFRDCMMRKGYAS